MITKLDSYFAVRKNKIYERAKFNRRNQLPGETAEEYIMQLYKLVETCEYGDLSSEMIRDRLVVGILDTQLSERLQLDAELTLEKAKKMIRQREAVHAQQQDLRRGDEAGGNMDETRFNSRSRYRGGAGGKPGRARQCTRCGKEAHAREKCPAKDATCHRCNRKGHYSSQCFSKRVAEVEGENEQEKFEPASNLDTAFLNTMSSEQEKSWSINLQMEEKEVCFKMDTGAEVTAISEKTYQLLKKDKLSKPERILYGPSRHPLPVVGQFRGHFAHKGKTTTQPVFVIRNLKNNLLGLPTMTALNLVARMDTTTSYDESIVQQYPSVFTGLGDMGEPYEIQELSPMQSTHPGTYHCP